ncbi:MAG: ATP-binding domain-containing protein [Planctomycetaceae bacterium]|nr:ATP-binding domain-containing protein [Planctomycetaceae bacterium]
MLESARRSGLNPEMSKQAATKVVKFVALYDALAVHATDTVEEVISQVLTHTGYREHLMKQDSEEADNRIANIDELQAAAQEFDAQHPHDGGLQAYLESAVLVNETDAWESNDNAVTLMTLHAAKGLEFPVVFLVGVEEGTLPHERSMQDPAQLEEERRLLFVGITRAQEELQLSRALYRFRRGASWPTVASQFLMELPREKMTIIEPQNSFGTSFDEFNQESDDDDWFSTDDTVHVHTEPSEYQKAETPLIQTASEMFSQDEATSEPVKRFPPELFQLEMLITHPEYGAGKIIALSGQGKKRTATVEFFSGEEKKFRLAQSPLQPAVEP